MGGRRTWEDKSHKNPGTSVTKTSSWFTVTDQPGPAVQGEPAPSDSWKSGNRQ